jgi:hypothetical protein
MANELLDFVMALVRDPDAAARYAADPAQAIAEARLTDVTSADVNNLIPMVSDSLSMAAPAFGADAALDSNIWSSGAATAAFDAFAPLAPGGLEASVPDFTPGVIDAAAPTAPDVESTITDLDEGAGAVLAAESVLFNELEPADDVDPAAVGAEDPAPWALPVDDPRALDQGLTGFDLFD